MTLSLILACLWLIAANVIGMFPTRHKHWPAAYGLIALGTPLLVFVVWQNGIWVGLVVLLAAASVLRWPVRYLIGWMNRIVTSRPTA